MWCTYTPNKFSGAWVGITVWAVLRAEWNAKSKCARTSALWRKADLSSRFSDIGLGSAIPLYCLSSRSMHQDLYIEEYRAVVPYQCRRRCNSCSIPRSRNKTLNARERRSAIYTREAEHTLWDGRRGRTWHGECHREASSRWENIDAAFTRRIFPGNLASVGERARGSRDRRLDGGGAPQDGMVEETEDGKGRAAIPAACWQLYRVTLRRLSIRQPFESLATILSGFLVRPPSAPHPPAPTIPCYLISNKRQRFRDIPTTATDVTLLVRFGWYKRKICNRVKNRNGRFGGEFIFRKRRAWSIPVEIAVIFKNVFLGITQKINIYKILIT